jgi:hypothetical protein
MANLSEIIRATRASASALESMSRFNRIIADSDHAIDYVDRAIARGVNPDSVKQIFTAAVADKNRAMSGLAKARGRYERANLTLARNPL